jgi:hypothetical protein
MPTALREDGWRFFFFCNEGDEAPHIHVERDDAHAKFWLVPEVALASTLRFRHHELNRIRRVVENNQLLFLEKWNEHFED